MCCKWKGLLHCTDIIEQTWLVWTERNTKAINIQSLLPVWTCWASIARLVNLSVQGLQGRAISRKPQGKGRALGTLREMVVVAVRVHAAAVSRWVWWPNASVRVFFVRADCAANNILDLSIFSFLHLPLPNFLCLGVHSVTKTQKIKSQCFVCSFLQLNIIGVKISAAIVQWERLSSNFLIFGSLSHFRVRKVCWSYPLNKKTFVSKPLPPYIPLPRTTSTPNPPCMRLVSCECPSVHSSRDAVMLLNGMRGAGTVAERRLTIEKWRGERLRTGRVGCYHTLQGPWQ